MNFIKYIELGIVAVETVAAFRVLLAPKKAVTGAQIVTAVEPVVIAIQSTFNVTIPSALVSEIAATAATAIDKYVFGV